VRERLGYGQAELARELGVTPISVWRWEAGRVRVPGWVSRSLRRLDGAVKGEDVVKSVGRPGKGRRVELGERKESGGILSSDKKVEVEEALDEAEPPGPVYEEDEFSQKDVKLGAGEKGYWILFMKQHGRVPRSRPEFEAFMKRMGG
jgi:transcriptional regulator with XRE-family HTH domain